ncbi:MAG TPA: MgtC/SapB family protein [Bryobacteraceae bacterium]|jgi:putative Mg2+ transporter-C (MgtC) family protein|nr:MgtC/SapB family protein [Bryobacteraceae bacterium]
MIQLSGLWQDIWHNFEHVAIAFLLTAIVGWQSEREAHSAGVRTFPIVGMASCGYVLLLGAQPNSADQSRVLQGLITGIGFIGGGAILKEGATVRGTATAASVWNAGVIGSAVAMNHYGIAITLVVLNLFTLRTLLPLKNWLDRKEDLKKDSSGSIDLDHGRQ